MTTHDVHLTRVIAAPPQAVYDVWLDPKDPAGPWAFGERTILDARLDGLFYWQVEHEGSSYHHYGRFTRVEAPRHLDYTWVSEPTHGLETNVRISFEACPEGTKMTLTHTGLPDEEERAGHERGWTSMMDGVTERFAKQSAAV